MLSWTLIYEYGRKLLGVILLHVPVAELLVVFGLPLALRPFESQVLGHLSSVWGAFCLTEGLKSSEMRADRL